MTITFWLTVSFWLAVCAALLLTPAVIKGAGSLKLLDSPDGGRRSHERPVPRVGGVAVYLAAAVVACAIFARTSPLFVTPGHMGDEQIRYIAGIFLASACIFFTGLVDDIRGLSPGAKFGAQVLAAIIAWYFGARLGTIALGYGQGVSLGIFGFPILVIWLVGVTNAFNFIDGLNGLASGLAVVAFAALFIAGLALGNFVVLVPAAALGGALFGFLRFNFPRAKIFLGDSGSMAVGFLIAALSLKASESAHGTVLVVVPLLALAIPLMDTMLAILRRWLRHVPVSGADARHIHHRLLAMGVSPSRAAMILWMLAAAMASFGLLMALTEPFVASSIAILGLIGIAILLLYGTNFLAYHELIVATEVLMSAPSRARRVISDQILAVDLTGRFEKADSVEDLAGILSESAGQFGFLGMELIGQGAKLDHVGDHILPANWAWRLDYPIRYGKDEEIGLYVLSIWCSPEEGNRPYGAERIARVLGPALRDWFDAEHAPEAFVTPAVTRATRKSVKRRFPTPL